MNNTLKKSILSIAIVKILKECNFESISKEVLTLFTNVLSKNIWNKLV